MKVHLLQDVDGGGWNVWLSLEETSNPEKSNEAFIVGQGQTKAAALVAAAIELNTKAADLLSSAQGWV